MSALDVVPGQQPARLDIAPGLRQIVQYAGASGDFYEMHYDLDVARAMGHPDLALHGLMKVALMTRVVERWLDGRGRVTVVDVRYGGMDFRDATLSCRAEVTSVQGRTVRLRIWTENPHGETTTTGEAEVELDATPASPPLRSARETHEAT